MTSKYGGHLGLEPIDWNLRVIYGESHLRPWEKYLTPREGSGWLVINSKQALVAWA